MPVATGIRVRRATTTRSAVLGDLDRPIHCAGALRRLRRTDRLSDAYPVHNSDERRSRAVNLALFQHCVGPAERCLATCGGLRIHRAGRPRVRLPLSPRPSGHRRSLSSSRTPLRAAQRTGAEHPAGDGLAHQNRLGRCALADRGECPIARKRRNSKLMGRRASACAPCSTDR